MSGEGALTPLAAHEQAYNLVHDLVSLVAALYYVAQSHSHLSGTETLETRAVWALIRSIEKTAAEAEAAVDAEWQAIRPHIPRA